MSTPLNKDTRERIKTALMEKAFKARRAALKLQHVALAIAVYNDLYPPTVLKQIDALPEGWLVVKTRIDASFGGEYEQMPTPEGGFRLLARDNTNMFQHCLKAYPRDHALTKLHSAYDKAKNALKKEEEKIASQIKGQLYSYSSVEALVKHWPELEPTVKTLGIGPTPKLPVVVPAGLNEALGLP